jgi:hypothetical protein
MNANLAKIKAATEPARFVNAAVLSPTDPDMDCSKEAEEALKRERYRLVCGDLRPREVKRALRCEMAIRNIRARR